MKISRRVFLKNGGIAMIGMSTLPGFLRRAVAATPTSGKKKLVVLFQRGAADGLNIVVPFAEPNYYRMRPDDRHSRAKQRERSVGGRSRWILRIASEHGFARAAFSQRFAGHRARSGLARFQPLAFRRAGLHGIRHAGRSRHRRRMAESLAGRNTRAGRFAVSAPWPWARICR
jgi:uncharacterized protein (DUF1501 family)